MLWANPPVMISPAPPRARSAKYAASFGKSRARSSSPVCIEPMTMRFGSRMKPRSSGANSRGYFTAVILEQCGSARDLGHQLAREGVLGRDQQRPLQRLASAHGVALVDERPAEKGIGLGGAPFGRGGRLRSRLFEHLRDRAQVLQRSGLLVGVLAGPFELDRK